MSELIDKVNKLATEELDPSAKLEQISNDKDNKIKELEAQLNSRIEKATKTKAEVDAYARTVDLNNLVKGFDTIEEQKSFTKRWKEGDVSISEFKATENKGKGKQQVEPPSSITPTTNNIESPEMAQNEDESAYFAIINNPNHPCYNDRNPDHAKGLAEFQAIKDKLGIKT